MPFGCDSITTSTTSNAINLSGLSNTNAIQVFNNAWSANVFTQTTNALTLNIPNLTGGQTYHVKIQQYDTKDGPWKFICERTIDVTVSVGNDLAVSISATPTTYKQFTNQNFKISVANSGNAAFTNVKIVLTVPDKLVGGATATVSSGIWNSYCAGGIKCNTWTIPNIAANTTATMDIGFFVNDAIGPLSVSATLNASTPTDTNTANNSTTVVLNVATNLQNQFENEALQSSTVFGIEKISPNPSDGEIEIKVVTARAEEVEFRFVNTLGNAVLSEKRNTEAGINNLYFDTSTFSGGIYFVVPQTKSGKIAPTKFVKL